MKAQVSEGNLVLAGPGPWLPGAVGMHQCREHVRADVRVFACGALLWKAFPLLSWSCVCWSYT